MYKKKLIETSIPLDEINAQCEREKNARSGLPATLHLWWARRPLASARAVLFASMVDDPSEHPELFPTKEEQNSERNRLHSIICKLADWDNINDESLYKEAYEEMVKYAPDGRLPEFLDPFAGGGALPLEAQRLGLISHASDLNPVAVTINRAMIDIPARFCNRPPINPYSRNRPANEYKAYGLAQDVEYYAAEIGKEARRRLGAHYPDLTVASGQTVKSAAPLAFFWARAVECPNPACRHETPLVRTFDLGRKKGNRSYVEAIVADGQISYSVRTEKQGDRVEGTHAGTIGKKGGHCLHCGSPISLDYVRNEARQSKLGYHLMAAVVDDPFGRGKRYLSVSKEDEAAAAMPMPVDYPRTSLPKKALGFRVQGYGIDKHWKLYTPRQLTALTTFTDIVNDFRPIIEKDAVEAGFKDDGIGLENGGSGARAYADALSTYFAFAIDKMSDRCSAVCPWDASRDTMSHVFTRQAIPMNWDFAESNPIGNASGSFSSMIKQIISAIKALPAHPQCDAMQRSATAELDYSNLLISTDPPYYDNIDYSDLSDYFYIWMRRSLYDVYPNTFSTTLTPKSDELIATPYRFDDNQSEADKFFEKGMETAFKQLTLAMSDDYPMTVYYAYKQTSNSRDGQRTSTGWETMLQALMNCGLEITGTWPIRTEMGNRTRGQGSNALASSIVLVCRKRSDSSTVATRPEFQRELRRALKIGVDDLQSSSIAPVDMAQASIGPGMAAYSKYSQVVESDGTRMSVHTALAMINEQLDALMGESGEELDSETRFCLTWYEQFGFDKGDFGVAETLRNARGADFAGLVRAGVLVNDRGKTWLVRPIDVANPEQARLSPSCWSDLMAMVAALETGGGIDGAARAAMRLDEERAEKAKSLAYLLFQAAEKGKRTEDATWFNDLVTSWADISERAEQLRRSVPVQQQLDFNV